MNVRSKNTDQRVAPQPEFGQMTEGQRRFVQTAVTARDTFYGRSRTHTARANQIGARLDEKSRQLEALRQECAQLLTEKTEEERLASVNWDDYQAHEDALKQLGAQVPPPADPQPVSLPVSQGDAGAHAAQWNGVSDPTPTGRAYESPQPVGKCSGCGEPLWKGATGPVHAYGGADCFPEREDTPTAQIAEPVQ